MNCDDCLNFLEAHVDGETSEREANQVRAHLNLCAACADQFEALTAENEMYARYDRAISVSPAIWNGIAAQLAADERAQRKSNNGFTGWLSGLFAVPSLRFAMPALALIAIAVVVGLAYWRMRPPQQPESVLLANNKTAKPTRVDVVTPPVDGHDEKQKPAPTEQQDRKLPGGATVIRAKDTGRPRHTPVNTADQSDVLPDIAAATDIDDRDTASHLEQAQNLLVSFRNIQFSDDDSEVDVSYEKTESRRLLSENVLLRREAEQAGKFPAKSMLGSLEPFLIDISNLPDKAKPADVRQITDRVQRTEIVAELRGY